MSSSSAADASARRRKGVALVAVATVLWSLAGLFTRAVGHLDLGTILWLRAGFGALCIACWGLVEHRRGTLGPRLGFGRKAWIIVPTATVAISAYVAALTLTTVADVLVIYATLPFVAALLSFVITGERPERRTLIAAGIALTGVAAMVATGLGRGHLWGQLVALLMTVTFGLMIVLQRAEPGQSMTSVNAAGALGASILGFAFSPLPALAAFDVGVLFLFGLTTVCIAFVMFMEGAKRIPAAESGLISILDVALGPLWVFLAFGEDPGLGAIFGGVVVLGAVLWRMAPDLMRARFSA